MTTPPPRRGAHSRRPPDRIPRILGKLAVAWSLEPDQRLGQFVSNLRGLGPQDIFYWEDGQLEAALDKALAAEGIDADMKLRVFAAAKAIEETSRPKSV